MSDLREAMFTGSEATSSEDLQAYTGLAAAERIVGKQRRATYIVNFNQMDVNYSGAVEYQLRRQLVLLCPQTVNFLYGSFSPECTSYRTGSRPELEHTVRRVTEGAGSVIQKAMALMRFCGELYVTARQSITHLDYVYGGTEEELIEKGEWTCECLSRLYVGLCEVAGVPGRILYHVVGGHVTTEVFLGNWAYVDPRMGIYFLKQDGTFASAWDLWTDPGILDAQDDCVKQDVSSQSSWDKRHWSARNMFFHPCEVNGFVNYNLGQASRYDYGQTTADQATASGLWTINDEYRTLIMEVFGLQRRCQLADW
jgi:hypothetical protein